MAIGIKTFANPAAGAEVNIVVPTNKYWLVMAVRFRFTTDVAAANRLPILNLDANATPDIIFQVQNTVIQTASVTHDYNFSTVSPVSEAPLTIIVKSYGIPSLVLLPGGRIRTTTNNMQGLDQYSALTVYVDEYDGEVILQYGTALRLLR